MERRKSVLCLDGGGSRGVITLQFLKRIETITGEPITQFFDLIIGTSTGGLIALMLAYLDLDLDGIERLYLDLSSKIFFSSSLEKALHYFVGGYIANTGEVEKIAKEIFQDIPLTKETKNLVKVAVIAANVSIQGTTTPFYFPNFEIVLHEEEEYDYTTSALVVEAALSTSAAPFFFKHRNINDILLQDGGLIANNPTESALNICEIMWEGIPILFTSLGTGREEVVETKEKLNKKKGRKKDTKGRALQSLTSSQTIFERVQRMIRKDKLLELIRLNIILEGDDEKKLDITNRSILNRLIEKANQYLENETSWVSRLLSNDKNQGTEEEERTNG